MLIAAPTSQFCCFKYLAAVFLSAWVTPMNSKSAFCCVAVAGGMTID